MSANEREPKKTHCVWHKNNTQDLYTLLCTFLISINIKRIIDYKFTHQLIPGLICSVIINSANNKVINSVVCIS